MLLAPLEGGGGEDGVEEGGEDGRMDGREGPRGWMLHAPLGCGGHVAAAAVAAVVVAGVLNMDSNMSNIT